MDNKITIHLASPRGFCAGVDRAIEIVKKTISKYGAPVYVRHEIVHNKYVVEDLKKQGFDPAAIEDKLYFYQKGNYVEIDDSLFQRIQSGEERF